MRTTINCYNREAADYVYDLLTHPLSGEGILLGSKNCLDSHELVPDVMEFDLEKEEVDLLKALPHIKEICTNDIFETTTFEFNKKSTTGRPKLATYDTVSNDCLSHSLYYCQNYQLNYTNEAPLDGSISVTLSTIDCSNVDVIIIDSGIDGTHPDLTDDNGNPLLVEFDWTQLTEANFSGVQVQILPILPSGYYSGGDKNGHGTACASLVVGKRCGFARNAKLYSLKSISVDPISEGISTTTALKLALAFQKAKKQNLYGLSSSRPTIISNSWGSGPFYVLNHPNTDTNHKKFFNCVGDGPTTSASPIYNDGLTGTNTVYDSYARELVLEGAHWIKAGGNSNNYWNSSQALNFKLFYSTHPSVRPGNYVLVRSQQNDNSYVLNQTYFNNFYQYKGNLSPVYLYSSPYKGDGTYNSDDYPMVVVGCVTPIGLNEEDEDLYSSGGQVKSVYTTLSGLSQESRIKISNQTRYNSIKGPFFTKTEYSAWGPDVDIYAPGNGTWAALSNQSSFSGPTFTDSFTGAVYRFFNGTSSATPIVAGCLATYLSQFPSSTPGQAKQWLLTSSVQNNIMETESSFESINFYSNAAGPYIYNVPKGANLNNVSDILSKINKSSAFRTANIDEILFGCRFFNSNNLFVQAYPLRKAVLNTDKNDVTVTRTNLVKNIQTLEKITHPLPPFPDISDNQLITFDNDPITTFTNDTVFLI